MAWIKEELKNESKFVSGLINVTVKYGNMATIRRIGYLLNTMVENPKMTNKLKHQLSNSNSLIPLVPGVTAKGSVDREWGVIVNG